MVGVRLSGLTKRFGDVVAVHPLDLDVEQGELLVLLGPSGCGKSTVLRMIAGIEEPTAGSIHIGVRRVDHVEPADRDVAMVFQNYALYPHMTVRDNLSFGLRMRRTSADEVARKVAWASSMLGLDALLERRPGQLSGGQRQRVALGRAMVREPSAFLFDEPLSNLDARLRAEMRDEIAALHRRLGATMIFVTHDQVEAMSLGQRVAVLKDGVLQQCAAPMEVYRQPANLFVAGFVGSPPINTVEGVLGHDGGGGVFMGGGLTLAGSLVPGAAGGDGDDGATDLPVVAGVRPEDVLLAAPDDGAVHRRAPVRRVEALGRELLVHVEGPDHLPWIVRAPADHVVRVDDTVGLCLVTERVHVFDAATGRRIGALGTRADA
ncbi:MAG TPA: ABC transporter ATP-binding protein [Longimicrobiales bacterium]|nr:ABC transporter ATP-binding protein [Longimicrobiales bacterium]